MIEKIKIKLRDNERFIYSYDKFREIYYKNIFSDVRYIKKRFKERVGYNLNLEDPKTFNEKIQWLKLYNRNPEYTKLVDKYEVRKYIEREIGKKYLIPLIGVYDSFDRIDFGNLPEKFVLKCTHDSGGVVICDNKKKFSINHAKKQINRSLKRNYFYYSREWPYKNVKPRVICEKLMLDSEGRVPKDYKFFCFNGKPKLIQVDIGRFDNHKQNFYDVNWSFKDINIHCENDKDLEIDKPKCFDEMIEICKKLSKNIPHVRIDLYEIDGNVFFGEITFFHMSGLCKFKTKNLDKEMGDWINIELS